MFGMHAGHRGGSCEPEKIKCSGTLKVTVKKADSTGNDIFTLKEVECDEIQFAHMAMFFLNENLVYATQQHTIESIEKE